jgi:hypothetical protein
MDDITAGSGENNRGSFYKKARSPSHYFANGGGRIDGEEI